jgi:type II secretory pathway component GspD/PulD (secretin)
MTPNCDPTNRNTKKLATVLLGAILALAVSAPYAHAQAQTPSKPEAGAPVDKRVPCETPGACTVQTLYLNNAVQANEANEIQVAIRNMLVPISNKLYLVPSQNALVIEATPEQFAVVRKIIADLDRPRKLYRLTYTITEMDAGKRIGSQHFSLVALDGQKTVLKQGTKVPIATGSYSAKGAPANEAQTQFTYLDIGMNFDATLTSTANGASLRTKVEQLGVAEEKSGVGAQDPVIRQTALEGTSLLTLGKPLVLGSLDIPGSTRHQEVEVLLELVK